MAYKLAVLEFLRNLYWHILRQGRIELPKAARRHATFVDGKMLSATKYRIQIYWYKHVNRRRMPLMRSLTAKWFFEMVGIPSAVFVFDDDLAS